VGQMKDLALRNTALATLDDGWNDAAAEDEHRLIRGTLLKFRDFRWYAGKQGTLVEDGTRLIALATLALWQRWEDCEIVEKIIREPDKFLPAREKPQLSRKGQERSRSVAEHAPGVLAASRFRRRIHVLDI
jgi:hypothetical protein